MKNYKEIKQLAEEAKKKEKEESFPMMIQKITEYLFRFRSVTRYNHAHLGVKTLGRLVKPNLGKSNFFILALFF